MDQIDTFSLSGGLSALRSSYFLVGPTAVGKTAVAQYIAERRKWAILSADSMLVYKGMDIGTAKPTREERAEVPYYGIDLAEVTEPFNVGKYIDRARVVFEECEAAERVLMVTGGTGLYVKCLTEGLDAYPPGDAGIRQRAEQLIEEGGIEALQNALKEADGKAFEALADKQNPRRLIRALEVAVSAGHVERSWSGQPRVPYVGLRMEMDQLADRIGRRVDAMYKGGLIEEVESLLQQNESMSDTAMHAIGYAEVMSLLEGRCSEQEAMAKTIRRTRQLAKRQMTWFRNQANVEWIDVSAKDRIKGLAGRVEEIWEKHGRTAVNI